MYIYCCCFSWYGKSIIPIFTKKTCCKIRGTEIHFEKSKNTVGSARKTHFNVISFVRRNCVVLKCNSLKHDHYHRRCYRAIFPP